MPLTPLPHTYRDGRSRRFLASTPTQAATLRQRLASNIGYATGKVSQASRAAQHYVSPGGPAGYLDFVYGVEYLSGWLDCALDLFPEEQNKATLDWFLEKQIVGTGTTYTRPYSGGTDTYADGVIPTKIPATGTMTTDHYVEGGDKPNFPAPWPVIDLAYYWGVQRGFDSVWLAWFTTWHARLAAAINSVNYSGTTDLVTQYAGAYKCVSLNVITFLDGDHYLESCWAAVAMYRLAEMYDRAGNAGQSAVWEARFDAVQASIQAAFVEDDAPLYRYLDERFAGLERTTGTPRGYAAIGGGTPGTVTVAALDSDADWNQITFAATGTGHFLFTKNFNGSDLAEQYRGQHTRVHCRAKAGQTTALVIATRADGLAGGPVVMVSFGDDGHFKYYNGATHVNLPTDTTYSAGTWYEVDCHLTWGATDTAEIFVNGVSKGTVPLENATATLDQALFGVDYGVSGSTVTYSRYCWARVPATQPPCGYLTWSSGPKGRQLSPLATSYAAYAGLLTTDQTTRACNQIALLVGQPQGELYAGGDGRGPYVTRFSGANGYPTWMIPADHWEPGQNALWPHVVGGPYDYGYFINGGYVNWGFLWMLWALYQGDPAAAQDLYDDMIGDIAADSAVELPHEKVSMADKAVENNLYLQGTVALYAAGTGAAPALPAVSDVREGVAVRAEVGTFAGLDAADIAAAVWGAARASYTAAGTFGEAGGRVMVALPPVGYAEPLGLPVLQTNGRLENLTIDEDALAPSATAAIADALLARDRAGGADGGATVSRSLASLPDSVAPGSAGGLIRLGANVTTAGLSVDGGTGSALTLTTTAADLAALRLVSSASGGSGVNATGQYGALFTGGSVGVQASGTSGSGLTAVSVFGTGLTALGLTAAVNPEAAAAVADATLRAAVDDVVATADPYSLAALVLFAMRFRTATSPNRIVTLDAAGADMEAYSVDTAAVAGSSIVTGVDPQ